MKGKQAVNTKWRLVSLVIAILLFPLSFCTRDNDPAPEEPGKIIVLMYHRIVKDEPDNLYERSVDAFREDLQYLKKNNIKTLFFSDLKSISETGEMPPGNSAIITFDDGSNSWYNLARPVLAEYGMKATFFLWANMIGRDSFLTWEEVRDMSHYQLPGGERPFEFGSHSFSHVFLLQEKENYKNDEEYNAFLDFELGESKRMIEQNVPGTVDIFSLPFGDGVGNETIINAARRNGYNYIRTSVWAAIENTPIDLFRIPSLPILDYTPQELIGEYLGLNR